MARWWSIETGVVERIYDLSAGATFLLVEQGFISSLLSHGDTDIDPGTLVEILTDHRNALEMVMDLVGGTRQLTLAWIKELHALITRHQETATGLSPLGYVEVPLLRGAWKLQPNNPRRPDGLVHEYCPPEQVQSEMERLVEIHASLSAAQPEVRAAWLHHAFTQIHPFQDGNGRVARALASIDLIKAGLFPLLVDRRDKQPSYLPALEKADHGDLGPLVRFFAKCLERVLLRAISEAETTVGQADTLTGVLDAAQAKLAARQESADAAKTEMTARLQKFAEVIRQVFENAAAMTRQKLSGIKTKIFASSDETAHYFRHQIIHVARQSSHWADLREPRTWVHLRLEDGGSTNIVCSVHFVGNPSPGTCVACVFLEHRESKETPVGSEDPIEVGVEPLLSVAEEAPGDQLERVRAWADLAVLQGLAQWTRYL